MNIRVSILTTDQMYSSRLVKSMMEHYRDQLDIATFSQVDKATSYVQQMRPDVVLVDELFSEETLSLPKGCILAYLGRKRGVAAVNGKRMIFMYQKVSTIYHEILEIYAELADESRVKFRRDVEDPQKIFTFFGCAGGVGASTLAAACALRLARNGSRVLYLNLERLGVADTYFHGEGLYNFSRAVYALSMSNAAAKLEASARQDSSGVYYYAPSDSALDMNELDNEAMVMLFEAFQSTNFVDCIIVDMDFDLVEKVYKQIERSNVTVMVSDGSEHGNAKLRRGLAALETIGMSRESLPLKDIYVMYNRFNSQNGKRLENIAFREVGAVSIVKGADTQKLIQLISENRGFEELTKGPVIQ